MVFKILIFIILFNFSKSSAKVYLKSIFLDERNGPYSYCDEALKCNGKNHTLCNRTYNPSVNCTDFFEYDMEDFEEDIVRTHNGIRNRIAGRMNIPNMIAVSWDEELSLMALLWLRLVCAPWIQDPCTALYPEKANVYPRHYYVNQNFVYIHLKNVLPKNFIVSAIRKWYLEKNNMKKEPTLTRKSKANIIIRSIEEHNNFTQLAYPETTRVGCALVRVNNAFAFVCNYHEYVRFSKIDYGYPVSKCPRQFLLSHSQFDNLCVDGKIIEHSPAKRSINCIKFSLIITSIFCFILIDYSEILFI